MKTWYEFADGTGISINRIVSYTPIKRICSEFTHNGAIRYQNGGGYDYDLPAVNIVMNGGAMIVLDFPTIKERDSFIESIRKTK